MYSIWAMVLSANLKQTMMMLKCHIYSYWLRIHCLHCVLCNANDDWLGWTWIGLGGGVYFHTYFRLPSPTPHPPTHSRPPHPRFTFSVEIKVQSKFLNSRRHYMKMIAVHKRSFWGNVCWNCIWAKPLNNIRIIRHYKMAVMVLSRG